ncbi:MAG TPA: short-chain fatty acyl-CoA regulator family protein [Polyangiaceae bacterium]
MVAHAAGSGPQAKVNANIGRRLRELRIERNLQQADVARRLGVSAAYMNLLEKGKRAVQLPLLWKALELFGVELEPFMASLGEARVEESLAQLLDEPLLRSLAISEEDLRTLGSEPKAATTITALFNLYKNARTQLDQLLVAVHRAEREQAEKHALAKELSRPEADGASAPRAVRSTPDGASALSAARSTPDEAPPSVDVDDVRFHYTPFDEVIDFLQENENYFPGLEEAAERMRRECGWGRRIVSDQIARALETLGVKVEMVSPGAHPADRGAPRRAHSRDEASVIRRYDAEKGTLTVSTSLLEQRLKFQLAHTIGLRLLDQSPRLAPEMHAFRARHAETPKLIKIHLANYFAGALLLPYDDFFREVNRTRYDVELLSDLFEMSYEAVAHRICNLADPKRRGLPMHFLRSDIGGNISKRYAATGIRFPSGTGSCPKWAVHMAFLTPGVITKQYSIFPDGSRYFCFAKVVLQPEAGSVMRGTVYGIGLGTHADAAKHLAYADGLPIPEDFERVAIPVGISCRFCERADCSQRAAPSYKYAFAVDEYVKKDNAFSPLLARRSELVQLRKRDE